MNLVDVLLCFGDVMFVLLVDDYLIVLATTKSNFNVFMTYLLFV